MIAGSFKKSKYVMYTIVVILVIVGMIFIKFRQNAHAKTHVAAALPDAIDGTLLSPPRELGNFQLMGIDGKPFNRHSLQGHWSMLFFGYTHCKKACPTSMAALNGMYHQLQQKCGAKVLPEVVMVSIDPQRDTAARLGSYVKSYNSHFYGAYANASHIRHVAEEFNVVYTRMPSKDTAKNDYGFKHTADVMVVDPHMNLEAFLSYPHDANEMAVDYMQIRDHYKRKYG